jgi:hypothetical protein
VIHTPTLPTTAKTHQGALIPLGLYNLLQLGLKNAAVVEALLQLSSQVVDNSLVGLTGLPRLSLVLLAQPPLLQGSSALRIAVDLQLHEQR